MKRTISTGAMALAFLVTSPTANAELALPGAADKYGALAIDENDGDQYGWAVGYENQDDADDRAADECGDDCEVVLRFVNMCAAYVVERGNSSLYGWGKATTLAAAESRAMAEARQRGGRNLVRRVWGCSR